MPAMKMKSPARVPRFQVPVGLMRPEATIVFTPFGDTAAPMLRTSIERKEPIWQYKPAHVSPRVLSQEPKHTSFGPRLSSGVPVCSASACSLRPCRP